jgi:hypothetical protein
MTKVTLGERKNALTASRSDHESAAAAPSGNGHSDLLAGSPLGCTEAIMLAYGFTVEALGRLGRLGLDGLVTTLGTVNAAGRPR